ncbi:uncharacterized protein Tco025E_08179 [Trypanosoma conorhini]|uniref:Uncharacterized protein n=1 Tax=Trypanosoma conorhini TaxID=83891 RepID=A0A422NDS4_9TRYP|nr:uncharacterized protein Tco025E_08179 [Trypanosoma conorhini]RNF03637.1 hypothetical protein Tco025E_08179 [Trypanosoma conorhini]
MSLPGSRVEAERDNSTLVSPFRNVKRDAHHHTNETLGEELLTPARSSQRGTRRELLTDPHSHPNLPSPEPLQASSDRGPLRADWEQIRKEYHVPWHKESQKRSLVNNGSYSGASTPRQHSVSHRRSDLRRRSVPRRRTAREGLTSALGQDANDALQLTSHSPYTAPLVVPDNEWPFKINSGRRSIHLGRNEVGGSMRREEEFSSISPSCEDMRGSGTLSQSHRHSLFVYSNPEQRHEGEPGWRTFVSTVSTPTQQDLTGSVRRRGTSPRRASVTRRDEERPATPNKVRFCFNAADAVEVFGDRFISPGRSGAMASEMPAHNMLGAGRISHRPPEAIVPERVGEKMADLQALLEKDLETRDAGDAARLEDGFPASKVGVNGAEPIPLLQGGTNDLNTNASRTAYNANVPSAAAETGVGVNEAAVVAAPPQAPNDNALNSSAKLNDHYLQGPAKAAGEVRELGEGATALGREIAKSTSAYTKNGSPTSMPLDESPKPFSSAKRRDEASAKSTTAASPPSSGVAGSQQDTKAVTQQLNPTNATSASPGYVDANVTKTNNLGMHTIQRDAALEGENLTPQASLSGGAGALEISGIEGSRDASSAAGIAAGYGPVAESIRAAGNSEAKSVDFTVESPVADLDSPLSTFSWPVISCSSKEELRPVALPRAEFMVRCLLDI